MKPGVQIVRNRSEPFRTNHEGWYGGIVILYYIILYKYYIIIILFKLKFKYDR